MVTGVYEGGRVRTTQPPHSGHALVDVVWLLQKKCEQYWHEEVGEAIELEDVDLKIITTSITTHRDFVIRTMNLKKVHESVVSPK